MIHIKKFSQDKSTISTGGDSARSHHHHKKQGITRLTISRDKDGNETLALPPVKRGICSRCCRFIYFHGSIIGPAPCSFICLCSCSPCCTQRCLGPLNRSSFATKLMYIIFLGFVMLFSTIFIVIYPDKSKGVAALAPCMNAKTGEMYHIGGWWGDCRGHAGYFIVYRIFLAFVIVLLFLALCTVGVTTSKDFCRPGIHQGFWLWKFLLFFTISAVTIALITVKTVNVSFDETWMYIGSAAAVIFSFPQIIFFLELIEQVVIKVKTITLFDWRIIYWLLTSLFYLIDIGIIVVLCCYYTYRTPFRGDASLGDPVDYGNGKLCAENIGVIVYGGCAGVVLTLAMIWHTTVQKSQVYPNVGLLQASLVLCHTVLTIYIALANTLDVECRVVWYPYVYHDYSLDVAFSIEGGVHVASVSFTIIYFALIAETTSVTAPLSKALEWVCCKQAPKDGADLETDLEFTTSQMEVSEERRRFLLLNDEATHLQYSWACFHLFLIIGSLSIMMGMTNFIRPMADGSNASSIPGFWCKFIMSPVTVFAFLIPIVVAWISQGRRPSNFDESTFSGAARSLEDFADCENKTEDATAEMNPPGVDLIADDKIAN
ncbi:unnamed protein product [Allacma fusca]|uniref:Uncharacterized protein n=1 Tax=Allacma fusca TaxID=39272 RepID=A0A8J2LRA2_9HEXA|nr:unnamed protein product [Allacma fusca]